MSNVRLGVLLSGSGTNFQAILDAVSSPGHPGEIAIVISNRRDAYGLERARNAGIVALHINHRDFESRASYDAEVVRQLRVHGVEWVLLAGFMRILTSELLNAFSNRVINIHPALLPSFKGLRGQEQALEYGVTIAGATVHLVTQEMDAGPIIAQGAVPVLDSDDDSSLKKRILSVEHKLYPMVVRWICENRLDTTDGLVTVSLLDGESRSLFAAAT